MKIQQLFWLPCFVLMLFSCKQHSTNSSGIRNDLSVSILPYKGFDTALLSFVKKEILSFYNCPVKILASADLPANAFYSPRQRYKADSLLLFQKKLAGNADVIIGLTDKDISTRSGKTDDWGVFGLGYNPGKACVVSVYRLSRASSSLSQLKERLSKVVLHELGHNFGLPHCDTDSVCLMNDARGTIGQVDRERKWLCGHCKKLLSNQ